MLINTCIVLQSYLCNNYLFGRKNSVFLTFEDRLMEKNLSCWLYVGDISRVFIIKLSAFAKRYHTVTTGFAVSPRGARHRTRTCDINPEWLLVFNIISMAVTASPVKYVSPQFTLSHHILHPGPARMFNQQLALWQTIGLKPLGLQI